MTPHHHDLRPFRHAHAFGDAHAPRRQAALWWVTWITLTTMVFELIGGWWSGSLALTADGWHMGTHALALGGAAAAMRLARWAQGHARFAFGGWKIEMLAAYSSGLLLLAVALWLALDGTSRLLAPHHIAYEDALAITLLGLLVNLACAWVLARSMSARSGHPQHAAPAHAHHDHAHAGHRHGHGAHGHGGHAHDHNFRAAYLHVLADALTSVLALAALGGGLWLGWPWLDAAAALVGAAVIAQWSAGTLKHAVLALVDASTPAQLRERIVHLLESDNDTKVSDLHVWQVGPQAWSAAVSVVADAPLASLQYHERLATLSEIKHLTIEVHCCTGAASDPTTHLT